MTVAPDSITVSGRPVCFIGAHQDDITLMMGHAAGHHAAAGREVHGFTATLGDTSIVLKELNGERFSGVWNDYHYPYPGHEGYPPLTAGDFAAARDREDNAAAAQLGIMPGNHHSNWPGRKSSLTPTDAAAFLRSVKDAYPTAGIYTHHWLDTDVNHAALGTALRNYRLSDPLEWSDVRWFVRQEQSNPVSPDPDIHDMSVYAVPSAYAARVTNMVLRASDCYRAWNPEADLYAIGEHSVKSMFDKVRAGYPNYIVKPIGW